MGQQADCGCCDGGDLSTFCTHARATDLLALDWADNIKQTEPNGSGAVIAFDSDATHLAIVGGHGGGGTSTRVAQLWTADGDLEWSAFLDFLPIDVAMDSTRVYVVGLSAAHMVYVLDRTDGSQIATWDYSGVDSGPGVLCVAADGDGNVFVGGIVTNFAGNAYLVRFDSSGTVTATAKTNGEIAVLGTFATFPTVNDIAITEDGDVIATGNGRMLQGYSNDGTLDSLPECIDEDNYQVCDHRCFPWDTWRLSNDLADVRWGVNGGCGTFGTTRPGEDCDVCLPGSGQAVAVFGDAVYIGYASEECDEEPLCTLQKRDAGSGVFVWGFRGDSGGVSSVAATENYAYTANGDRDVFQVAADGLSHQCFRRTGVVTLSSGPAQFTGGTVEVAAVVGTDEIYAGGRPAGCDIETAACDAEPCTSCETTIDPPGSSSSSSSSGCPLCGEATGGVYGPAECDCLIIPDEWTWTASASGCFAALDGLEFNMVRSGFTWTGTNGESVVTYTLDCETGEWSGTHKPLDCVDAKPVTITSGPCELPDGYAEWTAAETATCDCAGEDGCFGSCPVTVGCCANALPRTLFATINDWQDCQSHDGEQVELTYNGSAWAGSKTLACGDSFNISVGCGGSSATDFTITVVHSCGGDVTSKGAEAGSTCDPLSIVFQHTYIGSGCNCCTGFSNGWQIIVTE